MSILACLLVALPILALGDKPDAKLLDSAKRCDVLSEETGTPHYFGKGRLLEIADAVPPTRPLTIPSGKTDDFKGYIVKFDTTDFISDRTYIRATISQFKALPALKKGSVYSFCYTKEKQGRTAINHPETMMPLEVSDSHASVSGNEPDVKILDLKKKCEGLSEETGVPHHHGEGRLIRLKETVVPSGKLRVDGPSDVKVFSANFVSNDFSSPRTRLRATNSRWKSLPPLQTGQRYAFCFSNEDNNITAINYPETMLLLKE